MVVQFIPLILNSGRLMGRPAGRAAPNCRVNDTTALMAWQHATLSQETDERKEQNSSASAELYLQRDDEYASLMHATGCDYLLRSVPAPGLPLWGQLALRPRIPLPSSLGSGGSCRDPVVCCTPPQGVCKAAHSRGRSGRSAPGTN